MTQESDEAKTAPEPPYSVGYKRPPEHSRFKPGNKASPGRPKGAKSFDEMVAEEARLTATVTQGGRERQVTLGRLSAKRLVRQAAEGNHRAVLLVRQSLQATTDRNIGLVPHRRFDAEADRLAMSDIIRRLQGASMSGAPASSASGEVLVRPDTASGFGQEGAEPTT